MVGSEGNRVVVENQQSRFGLRGQLGHLGGGGVVFGGIGLEVEALAVVAAGVVQGFLGLGLVDQDIAAVTGLNGGGGAGAVRVGSGMGLPVPSRTTLVVPGPLCLGAVVGPFFTISGAAETREASSRRGKK